MTGNLLPVAKSRFLRVAVAVAGCVTLALLAVALRPIDDDAGTAAPRLQLPGAPGTVTPARVQAAPGGARAEPAAEAVDPAWLPIDWNSIAPRLAPPPHPAGGRDALLVQLHDGIRAWEVGDRIAMAVPHTGAVFTPTIERLHTAFGSRSYAGRLTPEDHLANSFLVTVGPDSTFATLVTPAGAFELFGNRAFAWMMPANAMDEHVEYGPPDYYIPPGLKNGAGIP